MVVRKISLNVINRKEKIFILIYWFLFSKVNVYPMDILTSAICTFFFMVCFLVLGFFFLQL
jgi:hypothetical protein